MHNLKFHQLVMEAAGVVQKMFWDINAETVARLFVG